MSKAPRVLARRTIWTEEAFWANTTRIPDTGCWIWLRVTDSDKYGTAGAGPYVSMQTHRTAWALTHDGKLPQRPLVVGHRCHVAGCINPDHLYVITEARNVQDALYIRGMAPHPGRKGIRSRYAYYRAPRRKGMRDVRCARLHAVAGIPESAWRVKGVAP